jgi:hypothetical protein
MPGAAPVQSSSPDDIAPTTGSAVGTDGTAVTFNLTKAELVTDEKDSGGALLPPSIVITGTMTYTKSLSGSDLANKVGAITFTAFDNNGSPAGTASGTISNASSNPKSFTITARISNVSADKGPYTFKVKDTNSGASIPTEFYVDQSETVVGINQSAAWYAASSPTTADGTKIIFTDPSFTPKDNTSITVNGSVNYKNAGKSGAVNNAAVYLRLYTIDAQGNQTLNGNPQKITVSPTYNQDARFSANVGGLNAANKYAVQFVDTANGNATSTAKIIESKNGKFTASDDVPVDASNSDSDSNDQPTAGGKGLAKLSNLTNFNSIPEVVTAFVDNIVVPIAIPFLALAIIYTGFLFVRARGNPEKIKEAKNALKWTLIGGAIILAAYVIAAALQGTISDITGVK